MTQSGPPTAGSGTPASSSPAKNIPVAFANLPGWAEDDHLAAFKTFRISCPKLTAAAKEAAKLEMGKRETGKREAGKKQDAKGARLAASPDLVAACETALRMSAKVTRTGARAFFETHFTAERVVHAAPQGLLTGYYEPLLAGSRVREGRFQTPILRRPADLVNLVDEASRGTVGNPLSHARLTPAGPVAYATRAEIEAGALKAHKLELLYLADAVDVFFLQIQGSGRIKLTDGRIVRVQYDGKNGHPYTSIGRYLIDKGLFAADKMSMAALSTWLRADPARGAKVMQQNVSYVFFRELPDGSEGPLGALDIPLTPGRSLAVDSSLYPLGAPVYISSPTLTHAVKGQPYNRLMVAQDVGSAIRGPERGDIYFGSGDAAGRLAGITKHPGHLFLLRARHPGDGHIADRNKVTPRRPQQ